MVFYHGYGYEEAYQIRSEDDWNKVEMSIRGQLEEGMWKEFIFSMKK